MDNFNNKHVFISYFEIMNRPISTLVEEIKTASGSKLGYLRREIDRRFRDQDWDVQLHILTAMLQRKDKIDRKWVFDTLSQYFWKELKISKGDKESILKKLILYNMMAYIREKPVAFFIVEHMPISYVKERKHILEKSRGYFEVAFRLAKDPSFEVDYEKVGIVGYYTIMAKYKRKCDEQEARWRLADWIVRRPLLTQAEKEKDCLHMRGFYPDKDTFSYYNIDEIAHLMRNFTTLGFHKLVDNFGRFDRVLSELIMDKYMEDMGSDKNEEDMKCADKSIKYIEMMHSIAKCAIETRMDPDMSMKSMLKSNPILKNLVSTLELRPIAEPPF